MTLATFPAVAKDDPERLAYRHRNEAVDALVKRLDRVSWHFWVTATSKRRMSAKRIINLFENQMHGMHQHYSFPLPAFTAVAERGGRGENRTHLHAVVRLPVKIPKQKTRSFCKSQENYWRRRKKRGYCRWSKYDPERTGCKYLAKQWAQPGTAASFSGTTIPDPGR